MHVHKMMLLAPIAIVALALSACSSGTGGGNPSNAPNASLAPSASTPASGVAVTDDPCTVVTAEEASALAGVTFGPGKEETTGTASEPGLRCTYGAGTMNVFFVQLGKAADAASAAAQWDQERAEVDGVVARKWLPQVSRSKRRRRILPDSPIRQRSSAARQLSAVRTSQRRPSPY